MTFFLYPEFSLNWSVVSDMSYNTESNFIILLTLKPWFFSQHKWLQHNIQLTTCIYNTGLQSCITSVLIHRYIFTLHSGNNLPNNLELPVIYLNHCNIVATGVHFLLSNVTKYCDRRNGSKSWYMIQRNTYKPNKWPT